jgi:hypothetical protein
MVRTSLLHRTAPRPPGLPWLCESAHHEEPFHQLLLRAAPVPLPSGEVGTRHGKQRASSRARGQVGIADRAIPAAAQVALHLVLVGIVGQLAELPHVRRSVLEVLLLRRRRPTG